MKSSEYPTVIPYLIVKNGQKFIDFVEAVFDASLKEKKMRDELIIQHAEVGISECVIMFADATAEYPVQNGWLYINVEDADETFQKALDHGATIVMDLANKEYGRTCGIKDVVGNTWWITSVLPS